NGLEYVLGAPQIAGADIKLAGGKTFKMRAHNLSEKNLYVKSVKVNGAEYKGAAIPHSMFVEGGTLEFFMGEK
ncbi:MAG: glycoside hydrolase family 92 protein, partial [Opitutales bacterium]|nr:glycoside hydrolase family 92 protein [Opitutales bacterium]